MTNENLTERLNFEGDDVFLDGKVIFSVPHREAMSEINLLGVPKGRRIIYAGSGKCCYGPITILRDISQEGESPKFILDGLRVPDFNVYDIIPAIVNPSKTGFGNGEAVLTTGYGCAGSGVRLIGTSYPKTIEVVSAEEFQEMKDSRVMITPRLNANRQKGIITLDLLRAGFRLKPGKTRDPRLPSVLLDSNAQEWYVSQDIYESMDLTPVLGKIGVDIDKTIEANLGYVRIRH